MKGLLSLDLSSSLTSIPFTHLFLFNIPKNECYMHFGMCRLQWFRRTYLSMIPWKWNIQTWQASHLPSALLWKVRVKSLGNNFIIKNWESLGPIISHDDKMNKRCKGKERTDPMPSWAAVLIRHWGRHVIHELSVAPGLWTGTALIPVAQARKPVARTGWWLVSSHTASTWWGLGLDYILISKFTFFLFHQHNRFIFANSKHSLRKSCSPCCAGFFYSLPV